MRSCIIIVFIFLINLTSAFANSDPIAKKIKRLKREARSVKTTMTELAEIISQLNTPSNLIAGGKPLREKIDYYLHLRKVYLTDFKAIWSEIHYYENEKLFVLWDNINGVLTKKEVAYTNIDTECGYDYQFGNNLFSSEADLYDFKQNLLYHDPGLNMEEYEREINLQVAREDYLNRYEELYECRELGDAPEVHVRYKKLHQCDNKKNIVHGSDVNYFVKIEENNFQITANVNFTYKGNIQNKSKAIRDMKNVKQCVTKFYARHGIKLNLNFTFDQPESIYAQQVGLYYDYDRANSANFWTNGRGNGSRATRQDFCGTVAHELAHNFGLSDGYHEESACPDRTTYQTEQNLMANTSETDNHHFTIEQVMAILSPVCN